MATDILNVYPWITEDFIFDNVQKYEAVNDVTVKSFDVKCALGKGENYCSNMIRITVNYLVNSLKEEKVLSFILKAAIPNKDINALTDELQFFEKETKAYNVVLPKVEDLLKSIGDYTQLSPKCYGANEDLGYLLFEDLAVSGYSNVKKSHGLSFDHLKLTVTKVAKCHAATAFLGVTDPNILSSFLKPVIRPEVTDLDVFLKHTLTALLHVSKNWDGFEKIREKLINLEKDVYKKACVDILRDDIDFKVITHGDLWANNIMYKYDENQRVADVLLVDFAVGTWTPPIKDLSYLLFSSSSNDIHENEWDNLLKQYHSELSSTLQKLNYPKRIPTLNDIQVSFDRSFIYDALIGAFITTMRRITHTQGEGFLVFIGKSEADEKYRFEMFSNPECEEQLKFLLKFYDNKGMFELWNSLI